MKVLYIIDSTGASSGGGSKESGVDTLDVLKRHYGLKVRVWWRRGVSIMIMVYRFRLWVYSMDMSFLIMVLVSGVGAWEVCRPSIHPLPGQSSPEVSELCAVFPSRL